MPIHNSDIADIFNRVADFLDIQDKNQFRIRAYRNAARTVTSLSKNVAGLVEKDEDLTRLSGIGKDLAGKIKEIVETGTLKQLEELEKEMPPGLLQMMKMSTIGPKRVKALYENLGVRNIKELEEMAKGGKISDLEGFGQKTQQKILEEAQRIRKRGKAHRTRLVKAERVIQPLLDYLQETKGLKKLQVAGSFRRCKETVGDIDVLATCKRGSNIMDRFVTYEDVKEIIAKGKTKSSVILRTGLQVDLRVVQQVSYGAALVYFTGSKAHNIAIRKRGQKDDLKINEYGVFKNDERVAGKTEEEVYHSVNLTYIEPELRENNGEIEAAVQNNLPDLIELSDLNGDLQSHTKESDGKFSMEEMAEAAKDLGYEYLAVTDHSKRVAMAGGLDEKRVEKQIEKVEKVNKNYKNFRIIKSMEVDILEDGSLDLPNSILSELEVVVCAVHYHRDMSRKKQTKRVLKAMENPFFHILAHPTGRIIGEREPYEIDLEEIMKEMVNNGCFIELNAQPDRLDISDTYCRMAREIGVKVAISTDAHSISDLNFMRFGIYQGRRGWLEPDDVLNTRPYKSLLKLVQRN
ncbi:MAG: DNA polymerase/3'-5' exonuclease PolX [Calditrichaeota bacterium]|nr:DNA polymerase/3'-5' exonuclease PolX [Calditrichota bacterium]